MVYVIERNPRSMSVHQTKRKNNGPVESDDPDFMSVIESIMENELQPLTEERQRDDWGSIMQAAFSMPPKAFTVDKTEPGVITFDLGYMPEWMTFNVLYTVDDTPVILTLTPTELQVVSLQQINEWTGSVDCSYWLSTKDENMGMDLVGALNDWATMGMLKFTRTARIDPSWTMEIRFEEGK